MSADHYPFLKLRYLVGPLPVTLCHIQTVIKVAIRFQLLFLFDCMQITKYVFVIHLRNPSAVTEDFWSILINVGTLVLSLSFSLASFLGDEQQPIHFYLCSDTDMSGHTNFTLGMFRVIDIFSLVLFVFVHYRIYLFKRKVAPEPGNSNRPTISLGNIYSNGISIACFVLLSQTTKKIYSLDHVTIKHHPNILYMQLYTLIAPNLVILILTIVYYVQYPKIQVYIYENLKELVCKRRPIGVIE